MVTALMPSDTLSGADSDSIITLQSKSSVNPIFGMDLKDYPSLAKAFQSNTIALSHLEKKVENVSQTMKAMERYLSRIDCKLEQLLNVKLNDDLNDADPRNFRRHSSGINHSTPLLSDEEGETKYSTTDTISSSVEIPNGSPLVHPKEDGQNSTINGIVGVKVEECNEIGSYSASLDNDQIKVHQQVMQNNVEHTVNSTMKDNNSPRRLLWGERLEELRLYKGSNGDCNVPQSYSGGLGAWVSAQRAQHKIFLAGKSSSLNLNRMTGLEGLGFTWTLRKRASWEERFEELKKYSQNHLGSCDVPSHKNYKHLWTWCQNQRQAYRRAMEEKGPEILPERLTLMESIGFKWS